MNEIKPLLCRQCGSHDLRLEKGNYVCHYCGTVHYDAGARRLLDLVTALAGKNRTAAVVSAVVTALVIAGFAAYLTNRIGTPSSGGVSGAPVEGVSKPVDAGKDAIEAEKKVSAQFTDITPLPDVIGNIYFVGIYTNTGDTPVYPRAEIALYDENGEKVAVARGYGIRGHIMPGETIPISVLVQKAPSYKTVQSIGIPEAASYYQPRPKLSFSKLKMSSPEHRFDYYRVTGRVRNTSDTDAQYVQMAVVVFDSSGRIIAYAGGFLGQTVLKRGEEAPFSVGFHIMRGKPERFTVDYSASVYKKR